MALCGCRIGSVSFSWEIMNTLEDSLLKLALAAQQLNEVRDRMSAAITALENKIIALNLGVSGWVYISSGTSECRQLGYGKLDGKWGLLLRVIEPQPIHKEKECW